LSSTTFRPLGPRVTFTVSASWLTPASRALRASSPRLMSLDISHYLQISERKFTKHSFRRPVPRGRERYGLQAGGSVDDGQDVVQADDGELLVADLHIGAGVLVGDDLVARLDGHNDLLAVHHAAGANRDDLGHGGLLLGAGGEDDAALGGLLRL